MNFETKPIQSEAKKDPSLLKRVLRAIPRRRKEPMEKWQKVVVGVVLGGGALLIFWLFFSVYVFFSHFSISEVLLLFGHLETDENNRTQILMLGSGDANHDSPDLTDTIMVVSLNHDKGTMSMLSVPRDLWVTIPGNGGSRINRIYQDHKESEGVEGAMNMLVETVEDVVGQDIQYYMRIDFNVFREVVDSVGGVDITMEYKLCDDQYPDEYLVGYDPFCIEAGEHHVDGEMALRLARSRHGTYFDENGNPVAYSSDFDRAGRQQMIIKALKDKALQTSTLTSPSAMKGLWDSYANNVDTNMGFREIWALAGFGAKLPPENLVRGVIQFSDGEIQMGDFLYPPEREIYGGASVLRPVGEKFDDVHKFVKMLFEHPEFYIENPKIEILNGTKEYGLASKYAEELIPFGFNVVRVGNTEDDVVQSRTNIVFPFDEEVFTYTQEFIRSFIPGVVSHRGENYVSDEIDVTIELGTDAI